MLYDYAGDSVDTASTRLVVMLCVFYNIQYKGRMKDENPIQVTVRRYTSKFRIMYSQ